MAELNDINKIDLKKTLATQQTAKKNIKKYKNVRREGEFFDFDKLNKKVKMLFL